MGREAIFILVILGLIAAFEVAYYIRYGVEPITEAVKPKIREVSLSWGDVAYDFTEIIADVSVYNPSPIPITLKKVTFTLYMNNIKMGGGTTYNPVILGAEKDTVILFTTVLDDSLLDEWWISHIKNGEKTRITIEIYSVIEIHNVTYKIKIYEIEQNITTNILAF